MDYRPTFGKLNAARSESVGVSRLSSMSLVQDQFGALRLNEGRAYKLIAARRRLCIAGGVSSVGRLLKCIESTNFINSANCRFRADSSLQRRAPWERETFS